MAASALLAFESSQTGTHVMVIGILLQLVSMGESALPAFTPFHFDQACQRALLTPFPCLFVVIFCFLTLDLYLKARRDPNFTSRASQAQHRIDRLIYGIFFGSFFILLRCVYRTIELAEGFTGYLIRHEAYFLGLDEAPMVLTMAIFLWSHPHFCIEREGATAGSGEERASRQAGSPAGSFGWIREKGSLISRS